MTIDTYGNVTPSSAPIQQVGNRYTLTGNILGEIQVNAGNIVIDGNNFTVHGAKATGGGIWLFLNDVKTT